MQLFMGAVVKLKDERIVQVDGLFAGGHASAVFSSGEHIQIHETEATPASFDEVEHFRKAQQGSTPRALAGQRRLGETA